MVGDVVDRIVPVFEVPLARPKASSGGAIDHDHGRHDPG